MAHLTKLTISNATREISINPVIGRRVKLLEKLDEQLAMTKALLAGEPYSATRKVCVPDEEGNKKRVDREKRVNVWYWNPPKPASAQLPPEQNSQPAATDRPAELSGIVLVRQRPGSAEGVVFITIEDETGMANLIVWPDVFEKCRQVVLSATMLGASGRVQREGEVIHIVVRRLTDMSGLLASLGKPRRLPAWREPDDAPRRFSTA